MRFRTLPAIAALALVLAAPLCAWARSAQRILPGQKVFGELDKNDRLTVLVDGVAGMPLSASCKSFKGTTLRLDLALADPDGKPVDISGAKKTNASRSAVSFANVVLPRTGSYRLTVSSDAVTFGGFDLATKGAAPKKLSGTGEVTSGVALVAFDGLPGDKVTCTVKAAKKSPLKPLIHRFVDAGGAEQAIDAAKQTTPSSVTTVGASRFEIAGDAGTTGPFTWSLKFTRAKAGKTALDAASLDAAGAVTGVVVLDGETTRTSVTRTAKSAASRRAPDVRAGELVVSMPAATSYGEVEATANASMPGTRCTVTAALSDHGPYLLEVEHLAGRRGDRRAKSVTRALAKSAAATGTMEWCAPNGIVSACADPNDTLYAEQFYLRYLKLPSVWSRTEGSASVVIAVLDTGYVPHPDLNLNLIQGFDFVSDSGNAEDGDGWDSTPLDSSYVLHGTHVAGIVGARSNNKSGVAGVVWQTKLQPVRVLGKDGGAWFDIAAGVRWAAGMSVPNAPVNQTPARVINMSLGAPYDDPVMRTTIDAVHAQTNVVIVAAAGNEGSSERFYPAAYPDVIPIFALDANLKWASYSNWGDWISVGAPGGDPYRGQAGILSTYFDMTTGKSNYAELAGTSMASPQIAGVAALLISMQPSLTRVELRNALQKTALDLGPPGFDVDYGWGMVDADAALEYVLTPFALPNAIDVAPSSLSFEGVANVSQVFVRTKAATPVTINLITPTMNVGTGWLSVTADQMVTPATLTVTIDPTLGAGSYTGRIRLTTSAGVVDVPVRVVRAPRPKINFVVVSAVDSAGHVVAQATTNEAKNWAYTLPGIPLGRYRITALADVNANLQLDRVDEWEGLWPLRTQPEYLDVTPDSLDTAAIDVPLERYDARFGYRGVGAGRLNGAVAVRATDAQTGRPVASANVHLAGGSPLAVTDARGRAAVVGAFSGGQVLTVAAAGYGTMTRVGLDAQFQAFPLEPITAAPTISCTATVHGLGAGDRDVYVAVGDAKAHVVYDGINDPVVPLTYTDTGEAVPVSAVAYQSDAYPTKHAIFESDAIEGAFDVTLTPLAIGAPQARFVTPSAGVGPFTTAGAVVTCTTYLRWDNARWIAVGDTPLVLGQSRQGWWADPGTFTPALPMKFEVVATDTAGRVLRRSSYGTTLDLQPTPEAFTFAPATALVTPAAGATGVTLAPTLSYTLAQPGSLHRIVIEETGTGWRWTIWVQGATTSVPLPLLATGGLKAATNYRWSVETYRFGASPFDTSAYVDEELDTEPTSRTFSGWSTFKTQ